MVHKNIHEVEANFSPISLIKELARKSIHISACAAALFLIRNDYYLLELLFLPAMAIGFYITEKVDILGKTLSFGNRRKWGGVLLAIGLTIVMAVPAPYEVKEFAILILMIADVLASIVGKLVPVKKIEILGAYKSIGGSLAFAFGVLIAIQICFGLNSVNFKQLATILITLEIAEFLNWRGIDNMTLPVSSIILAFVLF